MAHKKLTIPKCLYCGKRLTPHYKKTITNFGHIKTGIEYFGKKGTDDMFCSFYCGVQLSKTMLFNAEFFTSEYIRLRYLQLQNSVSACLERGFKKDAQKYVKKHNNHHEMYRRKDFLFMADAEFQDLKIELTHKRIDIK